MKAFQLQLCDRAPIEARQEQQGDPDRAFDAEDLETWEYLAERQGVE